MAEKTAAAGRGIGSAEVVVPDAVEKVKFICSSAGKILPRPSDGVLKYVGGETRVVSVPRTVSFSGIRQPEDLMKKISDLFDGDFILKYPIGLQDLDTLVSVKSDEDLRHMLDEYNRLEADGNSRLRIFLFPTRPSPGSINHCHPSSQSLEQRYIDAINGVARSTLPPINISGKFPMNQSRLKSVSPSASSSPLHTCSPSPYPTRSPSDGGTPHSLSPPSNIAQNSQTNCSTSPEANCNIISPVPGRLSRMHKVHSSPSLFSLGGGGVQQNYNNQLSTNAQIQTSGRLGNHLPPPSHYHHHYHQHHQHHHHHPGYHSPGGRALQQEQQHYARRWPSTGRDEYGQVFGSSSHNNGQIMGLSSPAYYGHTDRGFLGSGGQRRWALGHYING